MPVIIGITKSFLNTTHEKKVCKQVFTDLFLTTQIVKANNKKSP